MNTRTTLTSVGALILLAVLAWVILSISLPQIPNTGTDTLSSTTVDTTGVSTSTIIDDRVIDSVGDVSGSSGEVNDPTGQSHSE